MVLLIYFETTISSFAQKDLDDATLCSAAGGGV